MDAICEKKGQLAEKMNNANARNAITARSEQGSSSVVDARQIPSRRPNQILNGCLYRAVWRCRESRILLLR
jgi:hypothetical protein